jgi:hypothetical protein
LIEELLPLLLLNLILKSYFFLFIIYKYLVD